VADHLGGLDHRGVLPVGHCQTATVDHGNTLSDLAAWRRLQHCPPFVCPRHHAPQLAAARDLAATAAGGGNLTAMEC